MRSFSLSSASAAVLGSLLVVPAAAILRSTGGMLLGPIEDTLVDGTNGYNGWGTFDQLIDHSNPSLGTFKQRYWYGTEFWKGPGSPVVMLTPGEQAADRFNVTYTTTARLPGLFAKEIGGAVIVLEHRYWGQSSPFDELTDENLQYLTLEDSIRDLTYFARNFDPPFDKSGASSPAEAPWVFSGGSYPGALAGWIEAIDPGTFWAYHGTSGVVEAIGDFWQYFAPVQEATPQNCSKDLSAVIDYVDDILLNGSPDEKLELKDKFMLGDLEDADFAAALENGPWLWQSTQFYSVKTTGYTPYYRFCDYIENAWPDSNSSIPGPGGVGVDKALFGYAKWFKEVQLPGFCEGYGYDDFKGELNTACFASLNASNPMYTDLTVGNPVNRQWMWMLCNEPFEYWQDGAPQDRPSIVSRLVNVDYWRTQCGFYFETYGIADGKSAEDVNEFTGGWSYTNTTRVMYANGQLDPWRDATVSSQFRPDGPLQSTPELPVYVIPGGIHCSDFYSQNWDANPTLKAIVDEEVATMKGWVAEFYNQKKRRALEWTG